MSNYKVTGNTFKAKNVLKDAGFSWDNAEKAWFGNQAAKDELTRITAASYSRANQKAATGINIEAIDTATYDAHKNRTVGLF